MWLIMAIYDIFTIPSFVLVHEDLKNFLVKLLRKSRKSVQPDKLNTALVKFCYTYSLQDGWEIERFGYQKASLGVKLRLIKVSDSILM